MNRFPVYPKQSGAALVTSLLILLLLTIIGIGSMRTSSIEEKMAGNSHDRELAFQAAEAALSYGENQILELKAGDPNWIPDLQASNFACDNASASGACGPNVAPLDPFSANWENANALPDADRLRIRTTGSQFLKPKYFIQYVRHDSSEGHIFRVTAKGVGGDSSAEVILQSTYAVP